MAEALCGLGYGVCPGDNLPAHRAYADVIAERLTAGANVRFGSSLCKNAEAA